jgi:hypothetical protein
MTYVSNQRLSRGRNEHFQFAFKTKTTCIKIRALNKISMDEG